MKLRTGREAWKVVTRERESISPLFMKNLARSRDWNKVLEFLRKHKILKVYKKGSVIRAEKHSPPLACFDSFSRAKDWVDYWDFLRENTKIIKVVGYEKEELIQMSFNRSSWEILFIDRNIFHTILTHSSITGSIGFRKVRVVE